MKRGSFPGQEEALRARAAELKQQADQRATRRLFLGIGLGGVLGSVSGWVVTAKDNQGQAEETEPERISPTADARHAWARRLAVGSLDDLCQAQVTYLTTVNQAEFIDDVMWMGVVRLANAAIERDPRIRRGIHTFILALDRNRQLPAHRAVWLELVRVSFR